MNIPCNSNTPGIWIGGRFFHANPKPLTVEEVKKWIETLPEED